MNATAGIALAIHVLGVVIWVGGMFFAYMVLRPVVGSSQLEPPQRLSLWHGTFRKFFHWVWISVVVILSTGYFMVIYVFGGFGAVGAHVHIMHLTGLVMASIFVFLYFVPYAQFKHSVEASDWPEAGGQLNRIRLIVAANLLLGLATVAVAAFGRFM